MGHLKPTPTGPRHLCRSRPHRKAAPPCWASTTCCRESPRKGLYGPPAHLSVGTVSANKELTQTRTVPCQPHQGTVLLTVATLHPGPGPARSTGLNQPSARRAGWGSAPLGTVSHCPHRSLQKKGRVRGRRQPPHGGRAPGVVCTAEGLGICRDVAAGSSPTRRQ